MRVLIAHEHDAIRGQVRRVLEPLGHEVRGCGDAGTALEACSAWAPDVALLDAELCHGDDGGLLSAIKRDGDVYGTSVIILLAGDPGLDDALDELRRGAHDFLHVPLTAAELVARVQSASRTKSLQEELLVQAQRLEPLVFEDPLTGLLNHRAALVQLDALVSGARRHGREVSIAMLDIDHFKSFNDEHGHLLGDRVLVSVARALRERLRTEDHIGRLGGEEFLVLLPDTAAEEAQRVADDLLQTVSETTVGDLNVTVSIGWATWAEETSEELLKRADTALYAAKNAGRNAVRGEPGPATLRRRQ